MASFSLGLVLLLIAGINGDCGFDGPKSGIAISDHNPKTLNNVSPQDCMKACREERSFKCLSIDYNRNGRFCYLADVDTSTVSTSSWPGFDYYELCKHCNFDGPFSRIALSDHNPKTLNNVSPEECMKACHEETSFRCLSIDYNRGGRFCYLADVDRTTVDASSWPGFDYYELACQNCKYSGPMSGIAISDHNPRTLNNASPEECMNECRLETDFRCLSIDYHRSQRMCYLADVDRSTVSTSSWPSFDYYELSCSVCGFAGPMSGIAMDDNNRKTLNNVSPEDCKKACQEETTFKCLSIDYNRGGRFCYLASVDRSIVATSSWPGFDYYELSC